MTYEKALAKSKRVGAANAQGDALLAQNLWTLSKVQAINREVAYNGAKKLGIDPKTVHRLTVIEIADLQFEE